MSLLCIGVQNSQTIIGLFEEAEMLARWRVATEVSRTDDEWALLVAGLVERASAGSPVDGVAVCSAVPAVTHELRSMLTGDFAAARHLIVGPGARSGLPVLMDNPREVGSDRVSNVVGALDVVGCPCIVVDFGTATTFDVADAGGRYVGGAIAPGIQTSVEALGLRGAQLRQVELVAPRTAIAKNTVDALQSGAVYGLAGQVDGLVDRMLTELGTGARPHRVEVVATGHLAPVVLGHCASITRHEPWLMLRGLRLLYDRNRT